MAAIDNAGPVIGRASAEDHQMLRTVFSNLLARAAGGSSHARRGGDRTRREISPGESEHFDLYYAIHDSLTADLRASCAPRGDALTASLIRFYAGEVVSGLYPECAGEAGAEWTAAVCAEIEKLVRDRVMPDIDERLDVACRTCGTVRHDGSPSPEITENIAVIDVFREINRGLESALYDGADLGRVLSRALNDRARQMAVTAAGRRMFIGTREAETILENLVGAHFGNRFRMSVVSPS